MKNEVYKINVNSIKNYDNSSLQNENKEDLIISFCFSINGYIYDNGDTILTVNNEKNDTFISNFNIYDLLYILDGFHNDNFRDIKTKDRNINYDYEEIYKYNFEDKKSLTLISIKYLADPTKVIVKEYSFDYATTQELLSIINTAKQQYNF